MSNDLEIKVNNYKKMSNDLEIKVNQQKILLKIDSVDINNSINNQISPLRHNELFPNNIRAIICGPSGCGKTNLIFVLLIHKNGLRYKNVYILSKSLEQEKYQLLKKIYTKVPQIHAYFCHNEEDLPTPQNCKPNSVIIIDDVLCLKKDKDKIRSFFCYGRHRNLDIFYLYQTYTHIDKHLLRDNCNFIILFTQDDMNLKHIFDDHINIEECTFDIFKQLCKLCWGIKNGFLTIDKEKPINNGRFRKNLDKFFSFKKHTQN